MELSNYGVTLRRLTEDKIEMLRNWRNDPKIQETMFYREYITLEMQLQWFHRINNDNNFYFIIEFEGENIGLINVKDVNYNQLCGETGVFIYNDKYLSTDVAYRAHLVMFDYVYGIMKLEYTYSHILSGNSKAYRFAEFLGCVMNEKLTSEKSLVYELTSDNYFQNKNRNRFIRRWNYLSNK